MIIAQRFTNDKESAILRFEQVVDANAKRDRQDLKLEQCRRYSAVFNVIQCRFADSGYTGEFYQ